MTATETPPGAEGAFRHEALLYAGLDEFTQTTAAFVRGGLEADEPVLVVVGAEKIDLLRSELGADAARVEFADMADIGSNPARIIPAWYDFVARPRPRPAFACAVSASRSSRSAAPRRSSSASATSRC